MSKKITELTELTTYATSDLLIIEDVSANTTKKITWANLIADTSITTAKIADDAITDAKLIYGKVRSRQGGSATNWQTTGTNTYDYSATNTFIQTGSIANSASPTTITFPTAFNQIPVVFAQVTSITGTQCFVEVVNISTTAFNCQVYDHTGATNNGQTVNWMAVGQ